MHNWGLPKQNNIFKTPFSNEYPWIYVLYFDSNLSVVCFHGCNWHKVNIGSGNGLAPNRCQAITRTNDGLVHWCFYLSPTINDSSDRNNPPSTPTHSPTPPHPTPHPPSTPPKKKKKKKKEKEIVDDSSCSWMNTILHWHVIPLSPPLNK